MAIILACNFIGAVGISRGQVNESELESFFSNSQYRKHSSGFFRSAKSYLDSELRKYPKGSGQHEHFSLMRKALLKKDPYMQAPPFLDVSNCENGDIGMLSSNGRFITFVKLFQILDENRALMKCSFDPRADDDEWSGPFLWVAEEGSAWAAGAVKEGKVFALGIISFKKINDYVYTNRLGGLRKVPAVEVLPAHAWGAMVQKHKKAPSRKKNKSAAASNKGPAGDKPMPTDSVKSAEKLPTSKYYLRRDKTVKGPFTATQIVDLAEKKRLKSTDEVGTSETGTFTPLLKIYNKIKEQANQ